MEEPKLVKSKVLGLEYYIHETIETPINGLPCYSKREIEILKTRGLSKEELTAIYNAKLATGASLAKILTPEFDVALSEAFDSPRREVTGSLDSEPLKEVYAQKRLDTAKTYASRIREQLSLAKIKSS